MMNYEVFNRELSWLAFNDRVLQEAADRSVPLIERIRFLGIFSNNLDEFFRVRVAALHRMEGIGKDALGYFEMDPSECLNEVQSTVIKLQAKFEKIYQQILVELENQGIYQVTETTLSAAQHEFAIDHFREKVRPNLVPIMLGKKAKFPRVKDKMIYLAIKLTKLAAEDEDEKIRYAIIELPTNVVSRFLVLPEYDGNKYFMMLDDVIRLGLREIFHIFDFDEVEAYTLKITRDAELDIEEDISKSLMDKLEKSIEDRKKGSFTRFVYDAAMPQDLYDFIDKKLGLANTQNVIPGGRYHNFKDFIGFPTMGDKSLVYIKLPPLDHPDFVEHRSIFKVVSEGDVMLTYPFQKFNYVVDLLREAAIDPKVKTIKINLYRVAKNSKIVNALINAVKNGKTVEVVLELQARFDEKNNLNWSHKLQEEGCKVYFGVPSLKVHSKLVSIEREEGGHKHYYTHIGSGNFHEGNASLYTDYSLLTKNHDIGKEVAKVFVFLKNNYTLETFEHILVSPFTTRSTFYKLIDNEIKNASKGKKAYIKLKLNNLQDTEIIQKLYDASQAGVKITCVIRGICCLIPGVKGMSENISVISIIDRYLEHTRLIVFANNGDEKMFITSADWMTRNLDRRVEVSTPVYDKGIKKMLSETFDIYLSDNTKARIIDRYLYNLYVPTNEEHKVRSQYTVYNYFKNQLGA